jgi:uncharacterized protein YcfJ
MESNNSSRGMHPLIAGAAVSVMLVSLLGTAAIMGVLPNSHGSATPTAAGGMALPAMQASSRFNTSAEATPGQYQAPIQSRKIVHHVPRVVTYAQAEPVRQYSTLPSYQQPAPVAQNSPLGIGVGAVLGGVLGNQIGAGRGRTLATIAGAIGGGYLGNEVAQRNR